MAFTSLATARRIADQPGEVTQVALALEDGLDVEPWLLDARTSVPDGVALASSGESLHLYRSQLDAFSSALGVLGAGLLLTAAFLIYLTLSMSVAERTRLYGTMRALGATRRQVRRVVYAEALAIGAAGTGLGLVLGVAVAAGLRAATDRLLSLFGDPGLVLTPWVFVVAGLVGLGVSLLSAMIPARRAARIEPAAAVNATTADEPLSRRRGQVALVTLGVGVGVLTTRDDLGSVLVGMVLLGVGAVRLVPYAIQPIARALAPLMARVSRVGGRVAVQHLMAERTRSANTLALVMLVMTMTVAIMAIYSSFTTSLDRQLRATFGDALSVKAASSFDQPFLDALAEVDGVAAVTPRGGATAAYVAPDGGATEVFVLAIDPATYFAVADFPFVEGSAQDAAGQLARSDSMILPAPAAERLQVHVGDVVSMLTIEGPRNFTVAAVAQLSNLPAEFVIGERSAALFNAGRTEDALVRVEAGADVEAVRDRIEEQLGDRATFIVVTADELRADTRGQIGGGINSFFLLLALAAVVGTFGLANTMAVAVSNRYREIGVLRAIGARRRHIRGMAVVEALTLAVAALVLALPLGLLLSATAAGDHSGAARRSVGALPHALVRGAGDGDRGRSGRSWRRGLAGSPGRPHRDRRRVEVRMSTSLKQRALTSAGNVVRYVPLDAAQMFSFVASPRVRADPWALYQRLHRRGPVRKGPYGIWLVASHAGITSVLRDAPTTVDESQAEGFNGGDTTSEFGQLISKTLLFTDPPDHSRLRRLVSRAFTPRTVERLREPVSDLVAEQLARLRPQGRADLIADFALPLPVAVICELLGLPQSERDRFIAWGRAIAPRFDIDLFRSEEVNRLGDEAATAMVAYFDDLLDHPERCHPEGLVPALVAAQDDDDRLDRMEVIALCALLLVAGFETTTNLIGNGVHSLLQQPDQMAAWRDDRVDSAPAVDELLRHDGPVQFTQRVLLDDHDLDGSVMGSHSLVALLIGAGNRDPNVFEDPDRLDLARDPNPHLALSTGIHHCLGAALARLEAEIAVPALLRAFPALSLDGRPTRRETFVLRGFTELPVRWRP